MTFFNGLFRNGRTTPTSAKPSPLEPSTPKSSAKEQSPQQPPSAFKPVSQRTDPKGEVEGRKEVTTPTPKGKKSRDGSRVVRVKDFASPQGGVESSPSGPPPDRPLPPTPQPVGDSARVLGVKQDDSRYPTITRLGEALDTVAQRHPTQHQRTPSSSSQHPTRSTGLAQQPSKRQSIRFASPPHINPCPVLTTPIDTFPTLASMLHSLTSRGHLDRKKRPTALRLRTSNLTPAASVTSNQLSPRRMEVGIGRKNTHVRTLQYSKSKKQIAVPTRAPTIAEQVEEEAVEQLGEASSSIGTTVPTAPEPPSRPPLKLDIKPKGNPARPEPSATTSQNPTSAAPPVVKDKEATLTPSESGSSSGTKPLPFDNVPLPWNTTSISQLQQDLGEDDFDHLIAYTLQHLSTTEPRLLPLSVLRTSASEETRLRNELKRLRSKYETLLRHRDTTLASLATGQVRNEPGAQRRALDTLSRAVGRCDRVVRQIYLCNDQIRQIEIQGEEHVVGALRVALEQNGREISGDVGSPHVVGQSEEEEVLASSPSTEEHGLPYLPKLGRVVESNEEGKPRPRDLFDPKPRPESTASGFSINLGFPLPPSRSSPITSTPTLSMSTSSVDPHDTYPADETPKPDSRGRAASTSQLEIHVQTEDETTVHLSDYSSQHEILILPPGHHRRSTSAPLFGNAGILDIPRSPWRGPHDHSPQRPTGSTPPLRLKGSPKREKGGKAKSLMEKRRSSDLTRRARRGRESQLQTPESILLSLATVESWARQNKEEEW